MRKVSRYSKIEHWLLDLVVRSSKAAAANLSRAGPFTAGRPSKIPRLQQTGDQHGREDDQEGEEEGGDQEEGDLRRKERTLAETQPNRASQGDSNARWRGGRERCFLVLLCV